ncbi:MAG TPA: CerR family C-terminal domain-containing protein [Caldimonas sp.]|jgi:AcrR family transcriptional regulator
MKAQRLVPPLCTQVADPVRSDQLGEPARARLLVAALRLFAEQGYAKTSIRQIAHAAGVNVAAVSYYFGNKAGLYRSVFWGGAAPAPKSAGESESLAVEKPSLGVLFEHILAPLRSGAQARLWIKLHRREMIEPAGLWQEKVDRGMQPMHAALVAMLCQRLDLAEPDDEVRALATLIIGPAVHLLVNCEVIDVLAPQLLEGPKAIDAWRERLLRSAEVLIAAERRRRRRDVAVRRRRAPARPLPTAAVSTRRTRRKA